MNTQTRTLRALRRTLAGAAVAAIAALAPAGAALATPSPTPSPVRGNETVEYVAIEPGKVRAGERIKVIASCNHVKNSTATSDAFGTVTLRAVEDEDADVVTDIANVTLRRNLRPDTYRVTIRCGNGSTGATTFEVTGPPKDGPPKDGPETGGGGTDQDRGAGTVTAGLVTAGLGTAGLAGLGVVLIRRRRRDAADS